MWVKEVGCNVLLPNLKAFIQALRGGIFKWPQPWDFAWPPGRGMGPLIRLCLHNDVHVWFIPVKEPWRSGVVEKFNDHYEQKFLKKVDMGSSVELRQGSLDFEYRHNSQYRYSKLGGKTPLAALAAMSKKNAFPSG